MPDEFAGPHASTPTDSPADPLIGRTIAGKFAIEAKLGQGAMGAVYRARQIALEKVVAIKVLHQDRATDVSYAERFRREAKAASRLDHPNSIRVFDFGQEPDGLLYLAMEYVEGRDLRALLCDAGPFAPAAVADILGQVLAALAVAHDLGVLHRDLKPENIMIVRAHGDDGQPIDVVKVCDFGIAKLVEPAKGSGGSGGASGRRTTEGFIVGTPEYMSPEQARGEPIDGRSDLYSVGIVLYELLAGRAPFEGDSPLSIVVKHLSDAPEPPSSRQLGVDASLEAICLKALQKAPAQRFQSAREMRQALREAAGSIPTSAASLLTPPRFSSGRPYRPTVQAEKSTLQGVTPPAQRPSRRTRPFVATAAIATAIPIAIAALAMGSRRLEAGHAAPAAVSRPMQAGARSAIEAEPPPAAIGTTTVDPTGGAGANVTLESASPIFAVAAEHATLHGAKAKRPKTIAAASDPPAPEPATEETAETAPSEALAAIPAPPVERPPMLPTAATAPATSATVAPEPAKPAYDLTAAHVEIALAHNAIGATSSSITRAVSEAQSQMTACYRAALPRLSGALEGSGTLHVETDGEGVIADARWTGPIEGDIGRCIASAVNGRRVANVDTGSARADVPLTFKAR